VKTLKDWLIDYSTSHQNPTNKTLHWLCIPPIVFSVVLALKAIPLGTTWINPATIVGVAALAYYARLSWQLAAGMVFIFGALYAAVIEVQLAAGSASIWVAAAVFVLAWIGQFIGHHVEGARPSFFKDLQFLLIGPLWLLADVYRRLAIPTGPARQVAHQH
jgi:uncharacterized membrane protein YGL010W